MTSARSALVAFLVLLTTAAAPAPGPYDATSMAPAQLLEHAERVSEYYTMYFDYEGHAVYLKPNV